MINRQMSFSPGLYRDLVDMVKGKRNGENKIITEFEATAVAEQVVAEAENEISTNAPDSDDANAPEPMLLNMDQILREMEIRLNIDNSKPAVESFESVGVPKGHYVDIGNDLIPQLLDLGVLKVDENGQPISTNDGGYEINVDVARALIGSAASNYENFGWDEFIKEFESQSISVLEDLIDISKDIRKKYFVGPLIERVAEEKDSRVCDNRYILNRKAIQEDFADYPKTINTLEDLCQAIAWKAENTDTVNKKIDEAVEQGATGDCWLLSSVLAMASTNEGAQVINDAITVVRDGKGNVTAYEVEFKGALGTDGKAVKIPVTPEELKHFDTDYNVNDAFSNGDNDMLLLELATNKLHQKLSTGEVVFPPEIVTIYMVPEYKCIDENYASYLEGAMASRMTYLLTGEIPDVYFDNLTRSNIYSILENAADNPGTVLDFGMAKGVHSAKTIDGQKYKIDLPESHALAITDVTKVVGANGKVDYMQSTVTFVNPWDSAKEITVSWKEYVNLDICHMSSTSLNGVDSNTAQKPESYTPHKDGTPYDNTTRLALIVDDFAEGNYTIEQLETLLNSVGVEISNIYEQDGKTYVEFHDTDGYTATMICETSAIKDGVAGNNGEPLEIYKWDQNRKIDNIKFSDEEQKTYFSDLVYYTDQYGNKESCGIFTKSDNWPEGVSTPEELRAYLDGAEIVGEDPVEQGDVEESEFASILENYTGQDRDNVEAALNAIKDGDLSFFYQLVGLYEVDVYMAEKQEDGSYNVTISKNGASYTFNFSKEYSSDLVYLGLIEDELLVNSEFALILEIYDAFKRELLNEILTDIKNGGIEELLSLNEYNIDVSMAEKQSDGSYNVTISVDGASYTFNFDEMYASDLTDIGLLEDELLANSEFASILQEVESSERAYLNEILNDINNGDISAFPWLSMYDIEVSMAEKQADGSYNVTISIGSVTHTFNFDETLEADLVSAGLLEKEEVQEEKDPYEFESLADAIMALGLRETNCKGVFCQRHNPERPKGDYTHQKHYVWDEASHKMIELPGVYFIDRSGSAAKGMEGYDLIQQYQKGASYTPPAAQYEKDGETYVYKNGKYNKV